jgi:hypothetical protein
VFQVPAPIAAIAQRGAAMPGGVAGCSRAEMKMFAINGRAVAEAWPVTDLSQV